MGDVTQIPVDRQTVRTARCFVDFGRRNLEVLGDRMDGRDLGDRTYRYAYVRRDGIVRIGGIKAPDRSQAMEIAKEAFLKQGIRPEFIHKIGDL